jgi:acyl carrier protein
MIKFGKEEIRTEIFRNLRRTLVGGLCDDFTKYDNFVDMGASSIDRTIVVFDTIESFALDIPPLELTLAVSVSELVEMICEKSEKLIQ